MSEKPPNVKMPIQPVYTDKHGVYRFVPNRIVRTLLETGKLDMNNLACMDFTREERIQFAQLIGYSLSGFGELSYVDDESYAAARRVQEGKPELEARNEELRRQLNDAREGVREAAVALFRIHESDLET